MVLLLTEKPSSAISFKLIRRLERHNRFPSSCAIRQGKTWESCLPAKMIILDIANYANHYFFKNRPRDPWSAARFRKIVHVQLECLNAICTRVNMAPILETSVAFCHWRQCRTAVSEKKKNTISFDRQKGSTSFLKCISCGIVFNYLFFIAMFFGKP